MPTVAAANLFFLLSMEGVVGAVASNHVCPARSPELCAPPDVELVLLMDRILDALSAQHAELWPQLPSSSAVYIAA